MAGPGTLIGGVVAVGVGEAAGIALEPVLEPQRQAAWAASQARIFDLETLAQLVAQGLLSETAAIAEGKNNGYTPARVRRAIQLALKAAPIAEILELWRRGLFGTPDPENPPALVTHALAKAQIEPQYWKAITELFFGRLEPAVIATAIQRGMMVAPFDLPYNVNVPVGNVTPFPMSTLDAAAEAQAHGISVERLRIETALVGLPMALDRAAQAYFRGILTDGDYLRAVLEGNARGEWAQAELDVARQILTAGQYAELQLRGYYDEPTRLKNTAKHGMSIEDSNLLYNVLGRSVAVRAVTTGLARGGKYPGSYANVPEPYKAAIQRSNIREEYSELAYANRYAYPTGFMIKAEAKAGDLGPVETNEILLELGWAPKWATFFSEKWTAGTAAGADPHVTKAQTQLWSTTHASYKAGEIDAATVTATLPAAGVDGASIPAVLDVWRTERGLVRATLSAADIRKAYQKQDVNDATGLAWTIDQAVAALEARGWSPADAHQYLEIG